MDSPEAHTIKAAAAPCGTLRWGGTWPRVTAGSRAAGCGCPGTTATGSASCPGPRGVGMDGKAQKAMGVGTLPEAPAHCQDQWQSWQQPEPHGASQRSSDATEPSPRSKEIWRLARGTEKNSLSDRVHAAPPTPLYLCLGPPQDPWGEGVASLLFL